MEPSKIENSDSKIKKLPHILSRKQATILNSNVDPIICD